MRCRTSLSMTVGAALALAAGCGGGSQKHTTAPLVPQQPSSTAPSTAPPSSPAPSSPAPSTQDTGSAAASPSVSSPVGSGSAQAYHFRFAANGSVPEAQWPDACAVFSDADLKMFAPKTVGRIVRKGRHGTNLGSGGESPHYVNCDMSVPQPDDIDASYASYLVFDIQAIGDPAAVRADWQQAKAQQVKTAKRYPDQYVDRGTAAGASCFYDGNEDQCIAGPLEFSVRGLHQNSGASDYDPVLTPKRWQSGAWAALERAAGQRFSLAG